MRQLLASMIRDRRVRRVRGRLRTIASLGLSDWRVLGEALVTVLAVQIALRAVEFPRVLSWASRAGTDQRTEWSRTRIERVAWLVDVAGRLTRLRCLPRSLALTRVLARRGVAASLRIGVRTAEGNLVAHAWVECMGRALNNDAGSRHHYAAFERVLEGVSNA